ncbi:MAG: glycosyltransferase family 2 protein [Paludibacter sp.]
MTQNSKITIITPSYNQGKFIKRTIESVLNQGVNDVEYLVFDGGSTDETVEILRTYGDRIKWISEKDDGQADAVNKGLLQAAGDIIGWLNSDDIYYPRSFRSVLDIFDKHPDVDVIYGEAYHIDEQDQIMEEYYTEEWDYEKLKDICYICQPAAFFRKSVVEKYGLLDPQLRYCMDYEYWLRIGRNKPFYFLKEKLAGSRLYEENKTLGNRKAVHEEIISMMKTRLGQVSDKWVYNLAHVVTEDFGYHRNTPKDNYEFVKKLVRVSCWNFLKVRGFIPINEMRKMLGWLVSARRCCGGK